MLKGRQTFEGMSDLGGAEGSGYGVCGMLVGYLEASERFWERLPIDQILVDDELLQSWGGAPAKENRVEM